MSDNESKRAKPDRSSRFNWTSLITPIIIVVLGILIIQSLSVALERTEISYSEFKTKLRDSKISKIQLGKSEILGEFSEPSKDKNGKEFKKFRVYRYGVNEDNALIPELEKLHVEYKGEEEPNPLRTASIWFIGMILVLGFGTYLLLRRFGPGASALTFGRSRAKLHAQEDLNVSFDDVAGLDEAVAELREVVDFLKKPQKYQAIGGRIPKGVLLVGLPGTGKTLLAKAVAGEAGVPFFSLSGSDFVEMFVGVGAARVRDMFAQAEQRAPCIIFIDELDALGKSRGAGIVGGHDEREQTLNQLLVEMDGFESNRGVIIMAATNRPETLDAALLRPGRFDRTVVADRPDVNGREAILKVHIRNVKIEENVDLHAIASLTPGLVGADLANLINEAALLAARAGDDCVAKRHLEEAIERGVAGLERKRRAMLPEEKQRIAYHECGHAIVAYLLPGADPVHKISIVPRGVAALGYTLQRPADDRYLATQTELEHRICTYLGGIVAEELIFGDISTGAANDLERVTQLARSMVTQFGMSLKLGRVNYADNDTSPFLGSLSSNRRDHSEATAFEIDQEVKRIINAAGEVVRSILTQQRDAIELLAKKLLEKEVLDADELKGIMDQSPPRLVPVTNVMREQVDAAQKPAVPPARRSENDIMGSA